MIRNGLIALLLAFSGAAQADGSIADGEKKAQPCQACHGTDGNKTLDNTYPRLAGQYADYLAKTLRDYKTGERKNAIMAGFATTLTEQDIEDLAAYYASLKGELEDLSHLK